jgi:phosphoesterase RecJ-like protein
MDKETIQQVKNLLQSPKNITIIGHKNPDGDAIGSCLALAEILKVTGHTVTVMMPNDFPHFLKWLPQCDDIVIYEQEIEKSKTIIDNSNLIFTLDFNALSRVGNLGDLLTKTTADFIMIDHHQAPEDYAVAMYSDTSMSSTCEMVYHFATSLDLQHTLTKDIATQIYTGIMTDTGSFRFPATTAVTHTVIAHLVALGANGAQIHQNIYDTKSPEQLQLLGVALKNLVVLEEYNTAYITLSQKELDDHKFKKGDTEGFVNYALSVNGIRFAVIFIENKQESIVKISFRSKGSFSVNEFARNHYSGGGHNNAAGGKSDLTLANTVTEFISILPSYKEKLINAH